jgi:Mg2+ and Co2+ transporter CorA
MNWDSVTKMIFGFLGGSSVVGLATFLYYRRVEKLNKEAEARKTSSEGRKVEFDIYDGTIENWKDIVKEMREEMSRLRDRITDMEKNYLLKIAELEKEQQENKKLKEEVRELRQKVRSFSDRLSKYESLPKDENNNTIDI